MSINIGSTVVETEEGPFTLEELNTIQLGVLHPMAIEMEIESPVGLKRSVLTEIIYRVQKQYPEVVERVRSKLLKQQAKHANKQTGEKKKRSRSKTHGAVAIVHSVCDKMKNSPRKEVITACVAQGVNINTAKTQYYHWTKKQKGKG